MRVIDRIDYKYDGRGYIGDKRPHVFVVDVASGERRRVTTDLEDHGIPGWSPDGTTLAMTCGTLALDGMRLSIVDLATGATRAVGSGIGTISAWAWSPSGDRIILANDPEGSAQHDLYLHDVASGDDQPPDRGPALRPCLGHRPGQRQQHLVAGRPAGALPRRAPRSQRAAHDRCRERRDRAGRPVAGA